MTLNGSMFQCESVGAAGYWYLSLEPVKTEKTFHLHWRGIRCGWFWLVRRFGSGKLGTCTGVNLLNTDDVHETQLFLWCAAGHVSTCLTPGSLIILWNLLGHPVCNDICHRPCHDLVMRLQKLFTVFTVFSHFPWSWCALNTVAAMLLDGQKHLHT